MDYVNIKNIKYKSNLGIMGSEAIVYDTNYGLFKKFHNNMDIKTRKNKELKLLRLLKYEDLKKYYNEINYLVHNSTYDYLSGYIVEKVEGRPIDEIYFEFDTKINILKKLRKILTEFENKGIIYSDIHFDNIYYNTINGAMKLIDIDNIMMEDLPIDLLSTIYEDYFRYGGHNFNNARIFTFNLVSFMFLMNKLKTYNINEINKTTYKKDYDFLNNDAIKICDDLLNIKIDSASDHEYLIDAISKKILTK